MITKKNFNPECITYSQMNLIFNARIYYRRLTTWTRAYILSRYFGIGTSEELFGRLYLESLDIGNMLQIIFGREISEQYSQLLSGFAIAFRDLIDAQQQGNTEAVNENVERLYQNVRERSVFLEGINPYWTAEGYTSIFDAYIQYIIGMANAIASGDYSRDLKLYDELAAHTNRMGDVFAQGLYDYITSGMQNTDILPLREAGQCVTYDQMNEIYSIRMFWFELVTWVRNYMLSRYAGIGNANAAYERLRQIPVDYVNRVAQLLGDGFREEYIQLFYNYIDLIDAFITAQLEGNIDEINQITQRLYQNADERAAFIASINPFWDEEDARTRLYNNLRATIDESTYFLRGDYAGSIDIFSRILDQAESLSNWLAQGLFSYLNFRES
ncbi:MAG TPA: hypothetical protein VN381_13570 [Anaerovoracaceae bacterium]|nr:hypothetical protein [Anaerovoracaceae bacterium]